MQKPILVLRDDPRVRLNNQVNLASALRTALLMLPESFSETQLYETITAISYTGDIRMKVAENPGKVRNIVSSQLELFKKLYEPLLPALLGDATHRSSSGQWTQDRSTKGLVELARKLPIGLRQRLEGEFERDWNLAGSLAAVKGSEKSATDPLSEKEKWGKIVQEASFSKVLNSSASRLFLTMAHATAESCFQASRASSQRLRLGKA